MGAVIVVLAIIGFLVLFSYLKFPPPYANPKLVSVYNKMVMAVCVLLCGGVFLSIRAAWIGTDEEQWWLPVAVAGALATEISFLGLCFLMRNFWIFKPPRRPGGL
jgi:hypothetical protein